MLTIWGRRDSFNLQKVMWCVAELGVPHERIEAERPQFAPLRAWYERLTARPAYREHVMVPMAS